MLHEVPTFFKPNCSHLMATQRPKTHHTRAAQPVSEGVYTCAEPMADQLLVGMLAPPDELSSVACRPNNTNCNSHRTTNTNTFTEKQPVIVTTHNNKQTHQQQCGRPEAPESHQGQDLSGHQAGDHVVEGEAGVVAGQLS